MAREIRSASSVLVAAFMLATALCSATASAQQFDPDIGIGAGPIVASASSPLDAFDGAHGLGMQLSMEKFINRDYVWDLRLGGFWTDLEAPDPDEIYYPADDGDWSIMSTGLRRALARTDGVVWWAGLEGSYDYAQMKHFAYVGTGFGIGPVVAIDVPLGNGRFALRPNLHCAWVWLETASASPSRTTFTAHGGVDVVFRTRRKAEGS